MLVQHIQYLKTFILENHIQNRYLSIWCSHFSAGYYWLFVVLCGYPHENQRGIELKIVLSIENDEEPNYFLPTQNSEEPILLSSSSNL